MRSLELAQVIHICCFMKNALDLLNNEEKNFKPIFNIKILNYEIKKNEAFLKVLNFQIV